MKEIARIIGEVLRAPRRRAREGRGRERVRDLMQRFPVYAYP